jgi:hypothetical protein
MRSLIVSIVPMGWVPVMGTGVDVGVGDVVEAGPFDAGMKIGSPVRWLSITVANAKNRPPEVVVRIRA